MTTSQSSKSPTPKLELYGPTHKIEDRTHHGVPSLEALADLVSLLEDDQVKVISVDTETTPFPSWDPRHKILGIAIAFQLTQGFYVSLNHQLPEQRGLFEKPVPNLPLDQVRELLTPVFSRKTLVAHNWKYDASVLEKAGFDGVEEWDAYDTYAAAAVTNETRQSRLGLKHLSKELLARNPKSIKELSGDADLTCAPIELVIGYAGDDACNTLALYVHTKKLMAKFEGPKNVFFKIEMPVVRVCQRMEERGILVDKQVLLDIHAKALEVEQESKHELQRLANFPFDPNKAAHVRQLFYDIWGLPVAKKQGKVTADKKQLALLYQTMDPGWQQQCGPLLDAYMKNREAAKICSTYTLSLIDQMVEGRLHPAFLQCSAASGRFTSRQPNFQNMPADSETYDIRSAFIPDPGWVFVVYDYVQMEFKLAAAYSKDPFLVAAANDPTIDVHKNTAAAIFNKPLESITKEGKERSAAKTITFAILYGVTPFGLSKQLINCDTKRAKGFIKKFYDTYSGLRDWVESSRADILREGYAKTLYGRYRWADMKKLHSKNPDEQDGEFRKLGNTIIQGTGADITKVAMKLIYRKFTKEQMAARIVGQIHDELVVLCPKGEAASVMQVMEECMTHQVYDVTLPIDGDIKMSLSKAA